jgi:hypothetical protein
VRHSAGDHAKSAEQIVSIAGNKRSTLDKTFTMKKIIFCIITSWISLSVSGQNTPQLTLEDIYQNGTYRQEGFGPVRWMKDNAGYSTLESNPSLDGMDIVRYEVKSGERSVLVDAKQLIPTFRKSARVSSETCLPFLRAQVWSRSRSRR